MVQTGKWSHRMGHRAQPVLQEQRGIRGSLAFRVFRVLMGNPYVGLVTQLPTPVHLKLMMRTTIQQLENLLFGMDYSGRSLPRMGNREFRVNKVRKVIRDYPGRMVYQSNGWEILGHILQEQQSIRHTTIL